MIASFILSANGITRRIWKITGKVICSNPLGQIPKFYLTKNPAPGPLPLKPNSFDLSPHNSPHRMKYLPETKGIFRNFLPTQLCAADTIRRFTMQACSVLILLLHAGVFYQLPAQQIIWNKFLGGRGFDNAAAVALNPNEGSLYIGGTIRSTDGDIKGSHGILADYWVVKISYKGELLWTKALGGSGVDEAKDIKTTQDGGCILVGTAASVDGDVKGNHGKMDIWVVRLDKYGEVLWTKALGGTGNDKGNSVLPTSDGGFLILGESGSKNGDMTRSYGGLDAWVCKLDENGVLLWERSYGGSKSDAAMAACELDDFSVILLNTSDSEDFDVTNPKGNKDLWLLRIEELGSVAWQKSIGGEDNEDAHAIIRAQDGGLIIAGTTFSASGDIKSNRGNGDLLLVKTDLEGNLLWTKTYGGSEPDGANAIFRTKDRNYIVLGTTQSKDGMIQQNRGSYEGWVMKLNPKGDIIWQNTLGGKTQDMLYGGCETAGGDYIVSGYSESTDGVNTPAGFKGGGDWWSLLLRDPGKEAPVFRPPFVLKGSVREKASLGILPASVELIDNKTNKVFKAIQIDPLKGTFEFEIPKGREFSISVALKGYMFFGDNIYVNPNEDEMVLDIQLEKIKVGSKLVLNNIVFDVGSASIRPESEPELQRILKFMNMNPEVKIALNGHTDNTGDPNTKRKLSLMRAGEILSYLQGKGVYVERMAARGYGLTQPVASNNTEEGRQKNRRVEIEITVAP